MRKEILFRFLSHSNMLNTLANPILNNEFVAPYKIGFIAEFKRDNAHEYKYVKFDSLSSESRIRTVANGKIAIVKNNNEQNKPNEIFKEDRNCVVLDS